MAIKFKVLPRKNSQDITAPEKYYAAAIADGDVDLDRLAELISYQCTVTETDCYAVLMALEHNIIGELNQGRITSSVRYRSCVKLGRLGSFQVGLSSAGNTTAEEVSASAVTKSRILFCSGKKMRDMLSKASFKKAG